MPVVWCSSTRERVPHLHEALEGACAEGRKGLRQGPKEPAQEHHADRSLTLEGTMGEAVVIEGASDAKVLEAYVEYFLTPTLCEGRVVGLDNLGAHRTEKVRELIEARGADLLFLLSYSPEMNPTEEAFSTIENIVRKVGARTREALVEAISLALSAVTLEEGGMVRPLRLPATGAMFMTTAVSMRSI